MNAKAMLFAILIPDWNSLDSVRHAHSELEAAALVFFALLVLFEVLGHLSDDKKKERLLEKIGLVFFAVAVLSEIAAYPYGQRNDTLSEKVIGSLDVMARRASDNASTALSNSNEAETKSKEAVDQAGKARTKAEAASASAGKAQNKALTVETKTDGLNRDLRAAKAQLEAVEAKRAELEKSLMNLAICNAPRVLRIGTLFNPPPGAKKESVDPLKPFAGYHAVLEFIPNDPEASRATANIRDALKAAGWSVDRITPVVNLEDGVQVQPFEGPDDYSMLSAKSASYKSADVLLEFLHSYLWQASFKFLEDDNGALIHDTTTVPPPGVRIRVGLYPAIEYVTPPGAQDIANAMASALAANKDISIMQTKMYGPCQALSPLAILH